MLRYSIVRKFSCDRIHAERLRQAVSKENSGKVVRRGGCGYRRRSCGCGTRTGGFCAGSASLIERAPELVDLRDRFLQARVVTAAFCCQPSQAAFSAEDPAQAGKKRRGRLIERRQRVGRVT